MKIRTALLFTALALSACSKDPPPAPKTVDEETRRLEAGEVIIEARTPTDGQGVAAHARALVTAPPEAVFGVVSDCANFVSFMPRTKRSELRKKEGDVSECFVEIEMPFPLSNLWAVTRATHTKLAGGGLERRWTLVEGTYTRNTGAWRAEPFRGDPQRTLLSYELDVNPNMNVPDAIIRSAQTGSLPKVFAAVRERVGASVPEAAPKP